MEGLTVLCVSGAAAVNPVFMHEKVQRHVWTQFSWGHWSMCVHWCLGVALTYVGVIQTPSLWVPLKQKVQNNPRLCF